MSEGLTSSAAKTCGYFQGSGKMQGKIQNQKFHEFHAKQLECLLGFV